MSTTQQHTVLDEKLMMGTCAIKPGEILEANSQSISSLLTIQRARMDWPIEERKQDCSM